MTYDEWIEEVENCLWSMLGDSLDDYPEADLESLYEDNISPEAVVYQLYEGSEEDE